MTTRRKASTTPVSVVLETAIGPDGGIAISRSVRADLQRMRGRRVIVRVTTVQVAEGLEARGVTEDLVDRITGRQREERSNVVRCLLAEGSLAEGKHLNAWKRGSRR
jgi:hypothetical protein